MSKYTIELRLLLDSNVNLFDFDYNFVDDEHKQKLEEMFVNHFYFYEIGQETIGRFKHYLKVTFIEKLEYYEMLVKASQVNYDLVTNYDMIENLTRSTVGNFTNEGTNKVISNENSTNSNLEKYSDTPNGSINLEDNYFTNITDNNANSTNEVISDNTTKNINDSSSNENYTLTRKGNIGVTTVPHMLMKHIEYKKEVTNIINKFLEKECRDLFMKIY